MKEFVLQALSATGVNSLLRRATRARARVVTFHGVEDGNQTVVNHDRLQLLPDRFQRHLEYLGRTFHVVPLGDLVAAIREQRAFPARSACITFDDGYRNNLEVAAPLLARYGFPATFFVTTGYLRGDCAPWWYELRRLIAVADSGRLRDPGGRAHSASTTEDRVRLARAWERALLPRRADERGAALSALAAEWGMTLQKDPVYSFMTPDEARQLQAMGFDLQLHSRNHLSYRFESEAALRQDLTGAILDYREMFGRSPELFAFPYGHAPAVSGQVERWMRESGIQAAFLTRFGFVSERDHPFALRRMDISGGRSLADAASLLAGTTLAWNRFRYR